MKQLQLDCTRFQTKDIMSLLNYQLWISTFHISEQVQTRLNTFSNLRLQSHHSYSMQHNFFLYVWYNITFHLLVRWRDLPTTGTTLLHSGKQQWGNSFNLNQQLFQMWEQTLDLRGKFITEWDLLLKIMMITVHCHDSQGENPSLAALVNMSASLCVHIADLSVLISPQCNAIRFGTTDSVWTTGEPWGTQLPLIRHEVP